MKTTLLRFNSARPWRRLPSSHPRFASAWPPLRCKRDRCRKTWPAVWGRSSRATSPSKPNPIPRSFNGYATQQAADYANLAIQDAETGRFLVDIHPTNNRVNAEKLVAMLQERFPSFTLTALDTKYRGVGVVEGFISLDDVPALGNMREVRSVSLGLKPEMNRQVRPGGGIQPGTTVPLLGTVFDQGVYQHRVDQINKFYNPSAQSRLRRFRE